MNRTCNRTKITILSVVLMILIVAISSVGCAKGDGGVASEDSSATVESGTGTDSGDEVQENSPIASIDWDDPANLFPEPVYSDETTSLADFPTYKKPEDGEKLTFALLLFSRGYEWMVGLEEQFIRACESNGINPVTLDAGDSDETQLNQIQDCITKGYDAIVLTPNSADGLIPGVKMAQEAGVVLVTAEGTVSGSEVPLTVEFDRLKCGALAADFMNDMLGGKGSVLICKGAVNSESANQRTEGFLDEQAENFPNIKPIEKNCEWLAKEAQAAVQDVLMSNPDLGGVYSVNDEMQTGIEAGLQEVGRLVKVGEEGHIFRIGVDGTPLALERIRSGTQTATLVQDPFAFADAAVENTLKFLNGEPISKHVKIQPYVVTKANADNPDLWGNAGK